jgi:hypothetical protein
MMKMASERWKYQGPGDKKYQNWQTHHLNKWHLREIINNNNHLK